MPVATAARMRLVILGLACGVLAACGRPAGFRDLHVYQGPGQTLTVRADDVGRVGLLYGEGELVDAVFLSSDPSREEEARLDAFLAGVDPAFLAHVRERLAIADPTPSVVLQRSILLRPSAKASAALPRRSLLQSHTPEDPAR